MNATGYDNVDVCICCGGKNEVTQKDHIENIMSEAETTCNDCNFSNYWAFGYFSKEKSDWEAVQEIRKRLGINKTSW